ncbi:MAG: hypothetical protein EOR11_20035 [Mesorhizobium sp.]|uniref:hypothetical protein n=1 Tax=Mesorhizobium sp. TaxID=1871066 RepID=UPI000FE52AE7|nr:hypothetical protein [Mesorhizobium sp.]RWP84752.1 MAG: hypothetical protein EOR11_20035 [Mesorhizobium sp.]
MPRKARDPDAYQERPARPTSVKIGPFTWTIKSWDVRASNNTGAYGLCDKTTQTILIEDGMTLQWEQHIVLHEMLHACYCVAGLRELRGADDQEEAHVALLAFSLIGVLQDNPEMVAYLAYTGAP